MTMNRGRMLPTPLPWLTALIKPRVRDYVGVSIHILHPLTSIAYAASCTPYDDNEASAQDRARIEEAFVHGVYYGTLSTDTKRQLLGIPFDDFFSLCICELPDLRQCRRDVCKEHNDRLWYLLSCATHPQADIEGTLAPYLWGYYDWTSWPRRMNLDSERDCRAGVVEQIQALHHAQSNVFLGMTRFIGDNISLQEDSAIESIEHVIKYFLCLAMNAVDIHLVTHRLRSAGGYTSRDLVDVFTEGGELLEVYSRTVLRNPFSNTPVHVRRALAEANITEIIHYLLDYFVASMLIKKIPAENLHETVYRLVLDAALKKIDDLAADPAGNIRANMSTLHLRDSRNETDSDTAMVWTRPSGMEDMVTTELESFVLQNFEDGSVADVPIEPIGPRVDPGRLSDATSEPPANKRCPVCLESYTMAGNMCVKLRACAHLLHRACLDELVNGTYPGVPEVRCPVCRTSLCAV